MHVARLPVTTFPLTLAPRRGLRREWIFAALLVLLDAVTFSIPYLCLLRMAGNRGPASSNVLPLLLCLCSVGAVFIAAHRYTLRFDLDSVRFAAEHGLACGAAFGLSLGLQFSVFIFDLSRSRMALVLTFLVFTPLTLLTRRVIGRALRAREELQTFLVLGAGEEAIQFYRAFRSAGSGQQLRVVDLEGSRAGERLDGEGSPRVFGMARLESGDLLDATVEAVVVTASFSSLSPAGIETLVRVHFDHAPILTLEAFYEKYWRRIPATRLDPLWPLRQDFRLARDSSYRFFKRALDLLVAGITLLVAAPLLVLIALAIRLDSPGPFLYLQTRLCRERRPFVLYKFRTMRIAGCALVDGQQQLYTRAEDGRITRMGKWLRRLRIDELPQLWNVLRGEMSLIGPRAEWDRCVQLYERTIPGYHLRHLVKPGITGWAQVNFPYGVSRADAIEKLTYDLYYIKNYSLLLDASIVLKTIYVMLTCRGR